MDAEARASIAKLERELHEARLEIAGLQGKSNAYANWLERLERGKADKE